MITCFRSAFAIAFVAFACTNTKAADPAPLITPETPHGRLASVLQGPVDRHELAGGVLVVADKRRVLDVETVGWADIAAKKPMQTDTVFWIASQSKPITATALMMLVDEGKVNVDDPVEKYLPEFRGQMVTDEHDTAGAVRKKPIHPPTLANLLDHTSGLPHTSPIERPTYDLLPLATAVHSYATLNLRSEPGTTFSYANAGLNTIGRVIEVVSGMPYEQFLQKRIFDPLGMKDTTFWPTDDQVARLAKSYKRTPPAGSTTASAAPSPGFTPVGAGTDNTAPTSTPPPAGASPLEEVHIHQLKYPLTDRGTRHPIPAGGLFSTASDLTRFCQMILNHGELDGKRYLSEAAVQKMTSRQTAESTKATYGFGWSINDGRINHAGAYQSFMAINPGNGLISIYLIQLTGFTTDALRNRGLFLKSADDQFAHAAIR